MLEALAASPALQVFAPELHAELQAAATDESGTQHSTRGYSRSSSAIGVTVSELDSDGRRTRSQVRPLFAWVAQGLSA